MAEEGIRLALTSCGHSVSDWFLVGGTPWVREKRGTCAGLLIGLLIEDDKESRLFLYFLRRRGAKEYASIAEAEQAEE